MCLRRCLITVLILVGLLYLLRHPDNAAHTVKVLIGALGRLSDVLARFCTAL